MERTKSFSIPGRCCAIHAFISPDVDKLVVSTATCHGGYVSDDIKVLKRGSQVIRIYGSVCVVSASSSPVSRAISEPKEVRPFDEVRLPVWGITADCTGISVIVKHDVFLKEEI